MCGVAVDGGGGAGWLTAAGSTEFERRFAEFIGVQAFADGELGSSANLVAFKHPDLAEAAYGPFSQGMK